MNSGSAPLRGRVMFFGCWQQTGHYLHGQDFEFSRSVASSVLSDHLDGVGYDTPREIQVQGRVRRFLTLGPTINTHRGDITVGMWTVLDWWDRTVDQRHGSHSAFVGPGIWTLADLFEAGSKEWPDVIARQPPIDLSTVPR